MPSVAFRHWRTVRRATLDTVEAAHATIHGTGPGRREATRQLNHGYTVLLAAEFQGYCRELHTEAVTFFSDRLPLLQRDVVARALVLNRQLDRGNASPATLGSDYARLGINWWRAVDDDANPDGPALRRVLDELNNWRNAIAHNDFDPARLGGTIRLMLASVRGWRQACNRLAGIFDRILADHLQSQTGQRPW